MKKHVLFCSLFCSFVLSTLSAHPLDTLLSLYPEPDYAFVLETASFPGGLEALQRRLAEQLRYPEQALMQAVEGAVEISFAVGSDGRVFDVRVEEGIGHGCDEEAARIVRQLPRWYPARFGEDPICVRMRLLVPFAQEK